MYKRTYTFPKWPAGPTLVTYTGDFRNYPQIIWSGRINQTTADAIGYTNTRQGVANFLKNVRGQNTPPTEFKRKQELL